MRKGEKDPEIKFQEAREKARREKEAKDQAEYFKSKAEEIKKGF